MLVKAAELMKEAIEGIEGAYVGRWGGEEFMILVPGLDGEGAYEFAEKLRKRFEETAFDDGIEITASFGSISFGGMRELMNVFIEVDNALYEAKHQGRNKTVKA